MPDASSQLPTAIICLTGSELTRGETRDANGPFLGRQLTSLGVRVVETRLLPDDPGMLREAFARMAADADIVLISGGLGPTADDHTIQCLAAALGRTVEVDPLARERMHQIAVARLGPEEEIPANFYLQARVVAGARVLQNPVGLAPASVVETARGFAAAMPGVPRELRSIVRESLAALIEERFGLLPPRIVRGLILGHPESVAEARIQDLGLDWNRLEYGIGAKPGELLVRFIAHRLEHRSYLDEVLRRLEEAFGADFVALPEGLIDDTGETRDSAHARIVHETLMRDGRTVATAESCTGGWIAKRLTDFPGSSTYFLGSVVAYHDRIKSTALDVDTGLLKEHGAVSEAVCRAMAESVRRRFAADYGLAVTGIAGPGGGSAAKPVGLVYVGLAGPAGGVRVDEHRFAGGRDVVRQRTVTQSLEMLRRALGAARP